MTAGEGGSNVYGPDETAEIRRKEASRAAELIGAKYFCAGARDMNVILRHA